MNSKYHVLVALSISLASASCTQPTEPIHSTFSPTRQGTPRPAEARAEAALRIPRLSTSVEFVRTMVTGSYATAVLSVTNHERESVTLRFNDSCQLLYVVYDRHGTQVSEGWSCFFFGSTLTLGPGETVEKRLAWRAARYDEGQHGYVPLPTGPYRMHAYLKKFGYMSPPFVVRLVEQGPNGRTPNW